MLDFAKDYQVELLISSDLFSLLSTTAKQLCRQIDLVKTKVLKLGMYTVDYCLDHLQRQQHSNPKSIMY